VGSLVYNLPALSGQNAFVRNTVGGWELSSILNYASGPSVTPLAGTTGAPGGLLGDGYGGNERPDRVAGQSCRASGLGPLQWLNPAAFTLDHYALGTYPTSGRGVCQGPGIADTDFSIRKNFKLGERVTAKLSVDFFNLFNKTQFRADTINESLSGTGGTVCNATSPGATVTACPGYANDSLMWSPSGIQGTFGLNNADRGPREIQYGLRIEF
jgi:hypothetical protein